MRLQKSLLGKCDRHQSWPKALFALSPLKKPLDDVGVDKGPQNQGSPALDCSLNINAAANLPLPA
jgi:hypothetical protein